MKGHVASRPLLLVMMLAGAAPQSCPPNCKFCSTGLAECDPVSSLQQVLPGIPSLTEKILLRNGNLSAIHSAAFQNFSRLQLLSITGCLVSSLANMTFVTGEGSNLQSLDLSNNQLQSCRVDTLAFAGLARLQELILTNNAVDALKKSWFLDLNSLTKLLVSENKIAYLPPRTFESLMKLNHLAVAANQIQYLSTGTFSGLDSLTELDLSRNHILFVDEHTFKPLKTLRKLWLVRNRLVTLPSIPEMIEKVSLHENPWECTCELVNIVLSLKEKVQNPSSLLCDRPENLRGQQVVNVGPDICINATTPGENLQQQSSTSLDPLYSFIGGLVSALIICLIVCFITKRSKHGRVTNPTERRDDTAYSSRKGGPQKMPINMGATPEVSQCCLTSEPKQTWAKHQEKELLGKGHPVLFKSPSKDRGTRDSAVSPMVLAAGNPDTRITGAKRTDPEVMNESKGSNQSGNQFLGTTVIGASKGSERMDGLSKCFTAPDLLSASKVQQWFNPSGLFSTFVEPTCFSTSGSRCTPEDPQCYSRQGLQSTLDDPKCYSAPSLPPTPTDPKLYRTQGQQSTPEDPQCCTTLGLQSTPEDPQCCTTQGLQSTPEDPQCCTTQGLQSTPDDPKCYSAPALHPNPEDPQCYSMPGLHSTPQDPKYSSTPGLQPPPDALKCYSVPGLNQTPEDPKCNSTAGLHPTPEDQKCSSTPGIFPIRLDPKCFETPACLSTTGELQSTGMLPAAEDLRCLDSPSLLLIADDLPTKKVPHLPAEHFCNQNSTQMDDITNTESGLVKYFETQHEEKVMESMSCSEAPQHYPDALKSPVAHMKSIVKNNANDELGQKNLSKKCKTWSTFCNVASHSIVGQTTLEEQSHDFGDNLSPSNGNENFSKRKHRDHFKSEESTNSLGSGKSTDMTDSPRNGRFTEPSGTLRNDRSAELIDSLSNGRSEAPSDSQRNGRSTEMSGEHSISQRELVSFFSSVDSLSSDSGESYDEQDIEETEDLDSNLPPGESSQSTFAKLGKTEKSEDGLTLPETDSKRSSVKAKSADNCARREGTHHTRVGSIDTSYAESVGRRERRSKKHKMGVSLARDELLTERFWKFHTNCCDEYKPCPTAKKVLGHLKAAGVESSNHDSVRMTKEHFWKYHTSCCDEYKPCPTAKKVLHHLRKAPTGKLSNAYVRLTRERFWKYHRNCCDDYKPCPTAKKVMQRLKAAPSGQVDTNSIQSPPSDMDLLEDQHTFPLLSPKHVNGDEARAERDNKRPQSKNVISLPNLQMHLTHAGLYCAQNHCVSSERILCGIPRLVTVEPAQPGSTPQELSYGIYHHEDRTKVQPRTEMQDISLESPGNHECLLMASSVEDQMDTPHGTSRCCPPLVGCTNTNASAKLQRGSAKTISHVSVTSGGSNCGNLEAAGKSVTIEPPTTLRNHLQLSRVAFSDQASCGHPSSLPPVSGGTLNQNADEEPSKVECKVQVEHVTETPTSTDVSSDEDVQNLPRKEKITGTLSFGKAEGESRSKVIAAIHVKATGRYDPGGLVGAIDPTDSCTRLYGGTIFNASSNVKKYTMQKATNSLRRSSLKYAHNRVGFTPDPFLNNLCDKYANQPDEMKEQSCNDYALRNNPTVEGFAYKREMPKSHNLRKIVANNGNHRNVQEQGFHPTSRKPSAIRKDNHFCMGRENLGDSKDSNHTGRLCRRSAEKDVRSEETEQARGAPLPKSCLVADSKKKTKTNLNEYFLAKFARKTYHSVFNLPTGIPPCHSENASPVCPEVTKEEPDSILEPIEMKAAPGSTLMHKETEHNMGQVSTASEKDPEERTPYLSSLYRTTHQRKHTHDYFFKESDPALLEISELSVLSNLHFCKITEKTAFNAKEKEGNDNSGQENSEGDSPGTFDPVPSCSGHQYTPPTREELMGDSELAVINMLCNLKKSIDLSGELLILGNIKS